MKNYLDLTKNFKKFKFSIIIAVYNSELYLKEALDSVINQTFDFNSNVQLIIVDDGSTDNSKKICQEYQERFPNNIIFLSKDHEGVSSARNLGLEYASGEYVNFLDSDDYFSENTLKDVYEFFTKNNNRINIVSIPITYFGRNCEEKSHSNQKYNQIINLKYNPNIPLMSVSASFFKNSIKKNISFNEDLEKYEDLIFINKILLKENKFAFVNSSKYFCRVSYDFSRVSDEVFYKKEFLLKIFNIINEDLLSYCEKIYKTIPLFIQYNIMKCLDEIVQFPFSILLNEAEFNDFINKLKIILNKLDNSVIIGNKKIKNSSSLFFISLKDKSLLNIQKDILSDIILNINELNIVNNKLFFDGELLTNFTNENIKLNLIQENETCKKAYSCEFLENSFLNNNNVNNLLIGSTVSKLKFEQFIQLSSQNENIYFELIIEDYNFQSKNIKIQFDEKLKDELIKGKIIDNFLLTFKNNHISVEKLFNFSIVMAMYNVEEYLEDAINSLINQTISFEENVQLILVDDGSLDNSKEIALYYKEKYPNNILVLSKENGGHPSALNYGLEYVKGKYVNFVDSDDYLSENTLEEVLKFYEKYDNVVDVVTIPLIYFERINGPHRFNYRFNKTRVIDLIKEPKNPQYSVSNAFIKINAIKNIKFDERLYNGYDALVINKIIFDKKKYGVLSEGAYYYRQRANQSSIMDNQKKNKRVFTEKIKYYYMALINYCLVKENEVPFYIQYALANDLQGILAEPDLDVFEEKYEIEEFWRYLYEVISYISYHAFLNNEHILKSHLKPFFAFLKSKNEFSFELTDNNKNKDMVYINTVNYNIDRLDNHGLWLEIVEIRDGYLNMSGIFSSNFSNESIGISLIQDHNGEEISYECNFVLYDHPNHSNIKYLGIDWLYRYTFDLSIPINQIIDDILRFEIKFNDKGLKTSFEPLVGLSSRCGLSNQSPYLIKDNFILHISENRFKIFNYSYSKMLRLERHVLKKIYAAKEKGYKDALKLRILYTVLYPFFNKKKIWLFSDRPNFADDNGTYLFQYSIKQNDGINKYFVLNGDSKDYSKMKKINRNIIKYGSFKHKMLYLFSEKVISAFANEDYYDPFFGDNLKLYEGFVTRRKYFLQHGVTIGNYSAALNKVRQNFSLVLTSAFLEYESYLNERYNYSENIVQLLGLPRHDYLENKDNKKQIIFMPTWRIGLNLDENTFINSAFCSNLQNFLNNKELHKILKEKGYELVFRPHPELFKFIDLMDITDNVRVAIDVNEESYHDLFNESSIMITDYSSVFFDFAYLKKPIIYYQFDEYHYDKGYFDFETMGFGDILSTEDEVILKIKEYLDNDCQMESKYKDRVESFFKFNDKNNSKRVYNWIKEH